VLDEARGSLKVLEEAAWHAWVEWPSRIENAVPDARSQEGSNLRPLRHVLSDCAELLCEHALQSHGVRRVRYGLFTVIREGLPQEGTGEWTKLLQKGDGRYEDFATTFGAPEPRTLLSEAAAFRWAVFQLQRRVKQEDWLSVWAASWKNDGILGHYGEAQRLAIGVLSRCLEQLLAEQKRLAHSALPLENDPVLAAKYEKVVAVLDALRDDCSLSFLEPYQEWRHGRDALAFIIYGISLGVLTHKLIEELHILARD